MCERVLSGGDHGMDGTAPTIRLMNSSRVPLSIGPTSITPTTEPADTGLDDLPSRSPRPAPSPSGESLEQALMRRAVDEQARRGTDR
jgi:hypothetical protein